MGTTVRPRPGDRQSGLINMDEEEISPVGIILTVMIHVLLAYLASHRLGFAPPRVQVNMVVKVALQLTPVRSVRPVTQAESARSSGAAWAKQPPAAKISDLLTAPPRESASTAAIPEVDPNHYYRQSELSQQVQVLLDTADQLDLEVGESVILTLFIDEAGTVDEVRVDEAGDLSKADLELVISAFHQMHFLPGMRGEKIVKSLYRVQLAVHHKSELIR